MSALPNTVYTVWTNRGFGVKEPCVKTEAGNFIGCETGTLFPRDGHYESLRMVARVEKIHQPFETGMIHLDTEEGKDHRSKFLGAIITVRQAHRCGERIVYHSPDVSDYFTDEELVFL